MESASSSFLRMRKSECKDGEVCQAAGSPHQRLARPGLSWAQVSHAGGSRSVPRLPVWSPSRNVPRGCGGRCGRCAACAAAPAWLHSPSRRAMAQPARALPWRPSCPRPEGAHGLPWPALGLQPQQGPTAAPAPRFCQPHTRPGTLGATCPAGMRISTEGTRDPEHLPVPPSAWHHHHPLTPCPQVPPPDDSSTPTDTHCHRPEPLQLMADSSSREQLLPLFHQKLPC